jgi:hypothetical protein
VQLVAFVELQVSVEAWPVLILAGFAARETVGTGGLTVTREVLLRLPPVPVHVKVKSVVAASAPVDWLPVVAFAPVQPPVALQLVASAELQVSVDDSPLLIAAGFAVNVTVGSGVEPTVTATLWVLLPPAPEQVNAKAVLAVSAPLDSLPLVAFAPVQPPDAVQLVASVELQVSVDDCPLVTEGGLAVRETVGAGAVTVTGTV